MILYISVQLRRYILLNWSLLRYWTPLRHGHFLDSSRLGRLVFGIFGRILLGRLPRCFSLHLFRNIILFIFIVIVFIFLIPFSRVVFLSILWGFFGWGFRGGYLLLRAIFIFFIFWTLIFLYRIEGLNVLRSWQSKDRLGCLIIISFNNGLELVSSTACGHI